MSQPQFWAQGWYDTNEGFTPASPFESTSNAALPPSPVHPQESDCQDHPPSLLANPADDLPCSSKIAAYNFKDAIGFRHSGWQRTRRRVALALRNADAPRSRVVAFDNCGHRAYVLQCLNDPDLYKIASSKCKDRFCKPCARERAGRVARSLLEHVGSKELRFITLTLKTQTPNLSFELHRLYKAFQALRRRNFWKGHVAGGAALLEVKYNQSSDRWHPHLHILVEGRYVPCGKLADEWRHVTGDSFIVDVRAVKDNDRVTRYICKYATDPIDRSIGKDVDLLAQAIEAFKGRKSCLTFGSWRGVLLLDKDDDRGWRHITALNDLLWDAKEGDLDAQRILASLWIYIEVTEKNGRSPKKGSRPPPPDDHLFL